MLLQLSLRHVTTLSMIGLLLLAGPGCAQLKESFQRGLATLKKDVRNEQSLRHLPPETGTRPRPRIVDPKALIPTPYPATATPGQNASAASPTSTANTLWGRTASSPAPRAVVTSATESTEAQGPHRPAQPVAGINSAAAVSGGASYVARTYTVRKGDSLFKIARQNYGHAKHWRTIFNANRGSLREPNSLLVGQVLLLP